MGFFTKAKATKHERLSDANVKKLFDQYDVDHSGTLDHEEMVAALASLHLPKYLAERAWHLCDRDHSDLHDEFRHALLFLNPTDFALFADDWMHHASNGLMFFAKPAIGKKMKAFVPPFYGSMLSGMAGLVSRALFATADFLKAQYSKRTGSKPTALVGVAVGAVAGAVSTTVGFRSSPRAQDAGAGHGREARALQLHLGLHRGTVKTGGVGALYGLRGQRRQDGAGQAITFGCMTVIVPALTDALV
ncbi:ATP transmembrane transporter [Aureococcus anophagefferens]|nr:ATP transmembrane transporter [Aureococcus anophagefferens]